MTSLQRAERLGSQTPTFAHLPAGAVRSEAEDAAFLASRYGLTPDEWQRLVLEGWLGVRSDGAWAARRRALAVARQNGKNGIVEIDELFKMIVLGRKQLHTAHEVKTNRKAFLRLAGFFENERQFPELAVLAREIRRTNGQEAIFLTNGGSCEFVARSRSSGRGFTVDDLVLDEAQELTDDALAALLPTVSAAPSGNPQITFLGTPPANPEKGEVFLRQRAAALAGADEHLCWFEWANAPDVDLDDVGAAERANPALGIRISWETIADERETMGDDEFARERLGVWEASEHRAVIDPDVWLSLAGPRLAKSPGAVAFAVDVPPDGKRASLARAIRLPGDAAYVEVDSRVGTLWAQQRLQELWRKRRAPIVLDPGSRAGSMLMSLTSARVKVRTVTVRQVAAACGQFVDLVEAGKLKHSGQPELSVAVNAARKRDVADAWAWHRRDTSVDISPLVAATLAVHGLAYADKRRTGRSMAV